MGSCFRLNFGRKREYDFKNVPYQASSPTSGTYRHSAVDMDDWDPPVIVRSLEDNGLATKNADVNNGEDSKVTDSNDVTDGAADAQIVVSSPSNSDVTFGEKFQDVKEDYQEKGKKGKKEKKSKKEKKEKKEKKDKSKKNKKDKKKDKKGDVEEVVAVCNENIEKEEGDYKDANDSAQGVDLGDMETLPREDRYAVATSSVEEVSEILVNAQRVEEDGVAEEEVRETVVASPVEDSDRGSHNGERLEETTPSLTDAPDIIPPPVPMAADDTSLREESTHLQETHTMPAFTADISSERSVTPTDGQQEAEVSDLTGDARISRDSEDNRSSQDVTEVPPAEVSTEVKAAAVSERDGHTE